MRGKKILSGFRVSWLPCSIRGPAAHHRHPRAQGRGMQYRMAGILQWDLFFWGRGLKISLWKKLPECLFKQNNS